MHVALLEETELQLRNAMASNSDGTRAIRKSDRIYFRACTSPPSSTFRPPSLLLHLPPLSISSNLDHSS